VALSSWTFTTFWVIASLVLYVVIQIVAVGMLTPVIHSLGEKSIQTLTGSVRTCYFFDESIFV
jgi:hypothetical protein